MREWMTRRTLSIVAAFVLIDGFAAVEVAIADPRRRAALRAGEKRMDRIEREIADANAALAAAEAQLEEQAVRLEDAGLAALRATSSGLPGFLSSLVVNGWVTASYSYGLNDPSDAAAGGLGDTLVGASRRAGSSFGVSYMHPDHNSFALDEVWFELSRPIDDGHRAGFHVDLFYGKGAALIFGPNDRAARDDSAFHLFQAYAQWLAPIGDPGVTVKAGRFYTLLGIEGVQTLWIYNWNISRGNVWALFEPTNHTGVYLQTPIGDTGFDVAIAGVNGFAADSPDRNDAKSVTGHVGWTNGPVTLALNGIWGAEQTGRDGGSTSVLNALAVWMPSERFGVWLDADWARRDGAGDPDAVGVAVAARYGITDRTSVAVRGEWAGDDGGYLGFLGWNDEGAFAPTDVDLWSLTGTLEYRLTDQLRLRGEVRWDRIHKDDADDGEFLRDSHVLRGLDDDQVTLGIELVYGFNGL